MLLDRDPDFRLRVLEADMALTHFHLTLRTRIQKENAEGSATPILGRAV